MEIVQDLINHEILLIAVLLLLFVVSYFKLKFTHWKNKGIPYITPSIPFGNFENLLNIKKGFHRKVRDVYETGRKKNYFHVGFFSLLRPIYMPIDADLVKKILSENFAYFGDRGTYSDAEADPLSAHLFHLNGDQWKQLRDKLTPTFSSGKMKMMFESMLICGEQLKEHVESTWRNKKSLDIKETAACFTTDVIGTCVFGIECNSFKDPNSEFRKKSKMIFGTDVGRIIRTFLAMSFPRVCKAFRMSIHSRAIVDFFVKTVANIVKYRQENNFTRNDFMHLLIQLFSNEKGLSLNKIVSQSYVFFVAGFETTSSVISFCLYELAKNQSLQDRVRKEIKDVLANHGGKITYDVLGEMSYTQQVLEGNRFNLYTITS